MYTIFYLHSVTFFSFSSPSSQNPQKKFYCKPTRFHYLQSYLPELIRIMVPKFYFGKMHNNNKKGSNVIKKESERCNQNHTLTHIHIRKYLKSSMQL